MSNASKNTRMTERRLERMLFRRLERVCLSGGPIRGLETFEAAGVLTEDRGLVVQARDGREFQITIVRSR